MLNVIFDFNGTMFFDEAFQEKAWQQYMTEKLGRRITPEEFQTWIHGRTTGDTLEYFFGRSFTQQEADEEEEAEETIYRALCRQNPDYKLADGLMEFLDFLVDHSPPQSNTFLLLHSSKNSSVSPFSMLVIGISAGVFWPRGLNQIRK